ncbi:hypothetical protein [Umezawaea sp. Da 62-37]|uniref:hypothetical protein n=1 Tax=Umezawaea sp. Da 62-37 TaxID=3075927 RepID=UPI0028F6F15D|nr:hypothetical protein [Umezawaea sp. Da 62-37]WNV84686.1 hypothetical protein RM788_42055 [Umezawaea sp. Da 62-37]
MSGEALVDYAQIYVHDPDRPDLPTMDECFAGQANGPCGAAVPDFLFLVTGLRTGEVGFVVEWHDEHPPLDNRWEEIVEVSLPGWMGRGVRPLPPPVLARVDATGPHR